MIPRDHVKHAIKDPYQFHTVHNPSGPGRIVYCRQIGMQAIFYLLGRSAESIIIRLITIRIYYIFLSDLLAFISMLPVFSGLAMSPRMPLPVFLLDNH